MIAVSLKHLEKNILKECQFMDTGNMLHIYDWKSKL